MTDSDNFYSEKKKSPNSDRSGAVAGTTSTNGLNQTGNAHLNHWSLTQPDSIANLQKNTINTLSKIKIIKRVGVFAFISDKDDANSIIPLLTGLFNQNRLLNLPMSLNNLKNKVRRIKIRYSYVH